MDGGQENDGERRGWAPARWWRSRSVVHRRWIALGTCLAVGTFGVAGLLAVDAVRFADPPCDEKPTDITTSDYALDFTVPDGLMPDPQFNGQRAQVAVHRVQPEYQHGRCPNTPSKAAVLIHGRSIPGRPVFDLKGKDQHNNKMSVQEGLARAGIDTFAPDMLGYGYSTRFEHGLDDPHNASLSVPFNADGTCPEPTGLCDRSHNPAIFPLKQQAEKLHPNPLDKLYAHSSKVRFASMDTWVRDIRQAIDDAIAKAQPTDGKVTLVGYSLGGPRVGRTLYEANPVLPGSAATIAKVNSAVFMSSLFGLPTEEPTSPGLVSFPLTLTDRKGATSWSLATVGGTSDQDCTGRVPPGVQDDVWKELMKGDPIGEKWGGTDPNHPDGLSRTPTFTTYGFNTTVAQQLKMPVMVLHGTGDATAPVANATAIYDALPASTTNKVMLQVTCASHVFEWEGCDGERCTPPSPATVYGQASGTPWAGPHGTVTAALTEWITKGTVNGASSGKFTVDKSGVIH
ncbi:alpha/beta fold hydrolase [Streptomyces cinnamoneus]|uniref:alpha/beta hydrolase family protein n=1 Tax=Streptomyces cinnamoneus TaxID=53446 RepID=UPI0034223D0E